MAAPKTDADTVATWRDISSDIEDDPRRALERAAKLGVVARNASELGHLVSERIGRLMRSPGLEKKDSTESVGPDRHDGVTTGVTRQYPRMEGSYFATVPKRTMQNLIAICVDAGRLPPPPVSPEDMTHEQIHAYVPHVVGLLAREPELANGAILSWKAPMMTEGKKPRSLGTIRHHVMFVTPTGSQPLALELICMKKNTPSKAQWSGLNQNCGIYLRIVTVAGNQSIGMFAVPTTYFPKFDPNRTTAPLFPESQNYSFQPEALAARLYVLAQENPEKFGELRPTTEFPDSPQMEEGQSFADALQDAMRKPVTHFGQMPGGKAWEEAMDTLPWKEDMQKLVMDVGTLVACAERGASCGKLEYLSESASDFGAGFSGRSTH